MITKENLKFAFDDLNEQQVNMIMQSDTDYIAFSLCTTNGGGYSMVECLEYCEEKEAEIQGEGNLFIDKDDFFRLFNESGSTNEFMLSYNDDVLVYDDTPIDESFSIGLDFGLESITPLKEMNEKITEVDFTDIDKLLNEVSILDIVSKKSEQTSSKFEKIREEKVQNGFVEINKLNSFGVLNLNPLLLLLGKFWEHKEYRAKVKNLIDIEANELGYHPSEYIEKILGEQVSKLNNITSSIDRLLFIKTYYKPRHTKTKLKPKTKPISFDGVVYDVSIVLYNEALKNEYYKDNIEALKTYIKENSTIVSSDFIL